MNTNPEKHIYLQVVDSGEIVGGNPDCHHKWRDTAVVATEPEPTTKQRYVTVSKCEHCGATRCRRTSKA